MVLWFFKPVFVLFYDVLWFFKGVRLFFNGFMVVFCGLMEHWVLYGFPLGIDMSYSLKLFGFSSAWGLFVLVSWVVTPRKGGSQREKGTAPPARTARRICVSP